MSVSSASGSGINFTGLVSGIDTNSIVTQLVSLERQKETPYKNNQVIYNKQQSVMQDINSKLLSLQSAADALNDVSLWQKTSKVSSSNSAVLTASAGTPDGAAPVAGAYDIATTQLARNEIQMQGSSVTSAANADQITIQLNQLSGTTSKTLDISSGETIDQVVAGINALGMGVTADTVNGKLRLNAAGNVTVSGGGLGNGYNFATDLGLSVTQTHLTSQFTVSGTPYQRDTNTINDVVSGVTFQLFQNNSSASVTVTDPAMDSDKVTSAVQSFVDAYNAAYGAMHSAVTEAKVIPPSTTSDLQQGTLNGDQTLTSMMYALRNGMMNTVTASGISSSFNLFSEIGISTGASTGSKSDSSTAGTMVFDSAKFKSLLNSNPDDVKKLLQTMGTASDGSDSGLGERFHQIIDPYTKASGIISTRLSGISTTLSNQQSKIDEIEQQITVKQAMWQKQFTDMESLMSKYQTAGSALAKLPIG